MAIEKELEDIRKMINYWFYLAIGCLLLFPLLVISCSTLPQEDLCSGMHGKALMECQRK